LHPEPRGLAQATGAFVPESTLLGSLGTGGVVTMCSGDTDDFTWLVVWNIFSPYIGKNNPNISQLTNMFQDA